MKWTSLFIGINNGITWLETAVFEKKYQGSKQTYTFEIYTLSWVLFEVSTMNAKYIWWANQTFIPKALTFEIHKILNLVSFHELTQASILLYRKFLTNAFPCYLLLLHKQYIFSSKRSVKARPGPIYMKKHKFYT